VKQKLTDFCYGMLNLLTNHTFGMRGGLSGGNEIGVVGYVLHFTISFWPIAKKTDKGLKG
jgi:hypothetical protein